MKTVAPANVVVLRPPPPPPEEEEAGAPAAEGCDGVIGGSVLAEGGAEAEAGRCGGILFWGASYRRWRWSDVIDATGFMFRKGGKATDDSVFVSSEFRF
jgi:hypothetical protein